MSVPKTQVAAAGEKVSEELLKRISGEFCLDSIFVLDISCRGIGSLGAIPQCLNLCMLDLSSNHISSVGELAALVALEHLDLSDNNISQLEGLQKLENLSRLELAGNKISSFDSLLPLSSLCKLDHLMLQQSDQSSSTIQLSNPICRDPIYATTMTDILPTLLWLDKEMIREGTSGKMFYEKCSAIEKNSSQRNDSGDVNPLSNYHDLRDPLEIIGTQADQQSEEKIQSLLAECTDTSSRVQRLLSKVRHELKLPSTTA